MNIPATWLLIGFAPLFFGLVVMSVIHLFHAWRFGEHTPLAAITSGAFIMGMTAIIFGAYILLQDVDWRQSFEITLPSFGITAPTQSL